MGCSNQKAVELNEDVKKNDPMEKEEEKEEVILNNQEEEIVLEKQNEDRAPKVEEEQPKEEENKQEIILEEEKPQSQLEEMIKNEDIKPEEEEEKKSEEIPEDIDINEEENIEELNISAKNGLGSIEKNYEELKGSGNTLKSNNNLRAKSQNKNNNKNKKNKKKPFIITEIQSNPYQKVKIVINACSFYDEYMMPIWCSKKVYIKFRVDGKWRIDKSYDYTDSKGMPSNHTTGFNYGALIGRIGLGEKFVVADETAVLVKKEGPLFLRQNLPKNMKIEPEGKLEISIYDGIYKSIQEINNLIGWKENGTVDQNNENKENNNSEKMSNEQKSIKTNNNNLKKIEIGEKELENNLRNQLNNLRMNPTLFYEKYINFNNNLIKTKKFLNKIEKEVKQPLEDNEICSKFLEDYFKLPNQINFKKNLNKNNVSENLLKLDDDMGYFLYDQVNRTVIAKSKITQKDNPYEIILQFLLDKKFRTYIFSSHSQCLSIKVFKNFFSKSTLVIMTITLDKDYSQEEENIIKNKI